VNLDIALGVIDRILRTLLHIAHELELVAQRVPIEAPIGRLWRKRKVHHPPPKMFGFDCRFGKADTVSRVEWDRL
jgi:hypothetical protein